MPLSRHFGLAGRWAAGGLLTLAFWTFGLGLSLLLVVQLYIACSDQFEMPAFVVHALEQRLAAYGMHASFGRTRFDPTGRVLIEDARVTLPGFDEPLVTASSIYARLDLWALAQGRFEPIELRAAGASLRVPAMFSPSGRPDEIIRDLSADLLPRGAELEVASLDFRLGELAVSAHGLVHLGALPPGPGPRLWLPQWLVQNYGNVTREFAGAISRLGALDHPILQIALAPSESEGAVVEATLVATGLHLPAPVGLEAGRLRLTTEFPLVNSTPHPIEVDARVESLNLPRFGVEARGLRVRLRAQKPAGRMLQTGDLAFLDLSAADVVAQGVDLRTPSVLLVAGPWPKVHADIRFQPLDAPLAVRADLDFGAQTAKAVVEGQLAPALIDVIGARMHRDLRRFVSPGSPVAVAGDAELGPGWKFRRAGVRFAARDVDTWQHVAIEEVSGTLEYDGRRLVASNLFTRFGENFARGSYEMDVPTLRYRFLLAGRLRPLDIAPWFPHQPWWGLLFGNFQFPSVPPSANMEWQGQWPTDHETRLFLAVDAPGMGIGGVPYDRVFGRLFVRPNFDDALEFSVAQGAGSATGTFARWYDQAAGKMQRLDLAVASTLDVGQLAKVWPKDAKDPTNTKAPEVLTMFAFDRPPILRLTGRFDRPIAAGDLHWVLHLEGRTDSGFRLHGFPLDRTAFTAEIHDEDFVLDPFSLGFAGGGVTGRVQVSGRGTDKKIAVSGELKEASLPRAIELVQNYSSKGPPAKPAITGDFLKNMAGVRFDLKVSAAGAYADPLSYRGDGNARVQGPELMKVPMLGPLSALLPFTQLHFTTASADFTVNGPQLDFTDITVSGANSRIDARGSYGVDRHALNFNARVYPLRENKSLPGQLLGGFLTPLSELSRVRLTGSPDKPQWALVLGPTNLVRTLLSSGNRSANPPAAAPPSPLAHPAPNPEPGPTGSALQPP